MVAPDFDDEGVPATRPVADWLGLADSHGLPEGHATRWLQAVLRFSRADGSPVFGPIGRSVARLRALKGWAVRLGDPSLAGVIESWLPTGPGSTTATTPTPSPSDARADRPLAILRPDWSIRGDLVAIDHRMVGDRTLLEVGSRGATWLGPSWTSGMVVRKVGPASPTCWSSGTFAGCSEWSFGAGRGRVTRSVVQLRGRSLVLLGQQSEGPEPLTEFRLGLPEGIEASTVVGSRSILLSVGRGKSTARLIPLGLPSHDRPTDRGSIAVEGREVVVRQVAEGRKCWLAVLVCWGKAPATWRSLTVSHRSKACRGDVATASRVAWGPSDDGLVVYRSLARPALRAFLGHQTNARFLVGSFDRSGDVRPILKVDA